MRSFRSLGFVALGLFGIVVLAPNTACSTDNTCVQGSAMTNPRIAGPPQASVLGSALRIVWDAGSESGAKLPRAYFAAGKVKSDRDVGPDGPPIEEAIEAPADRELIVTLRTSPFAVRGALRFTIELPDRKKFISCERADDATDSYGLKVDAELASDGSVAKATLTEIRTGGE